jgi:hypothetical protein
MKPSSSAALKVRLWSCVTSAVSVTARNCTRDGGRPFEVGNQVSISSHRKLLSSKAMVVTLRKRRDKIPAGKVERGQRKRTAAEVSKAD